MTIAAFARTMSTFIMTEDVHTYMSEKKPAVYEPKPLVCRRCDYATEVLRTSCPMCGGDMIYDPES